ncbi:MAG TPA: hypothetical protein VG722_01495 [Tepidisphaeraceae bacterium]|nr:hypothetical protein [Tepidisphaeraceae bacterium]
MNLESERQLHNTEHKLALLEEQILQAQARHTSPENSESIQSLIGLANQLREEIVRFRARHKRRAS